MALPTPDVTIGSYKIVEQVGMGGMATVFKAYQANMGRHVAIKVLPDRFARDPKFVARFQQEVRTIAGLEHKNILPVYDFGEENGTAYMVMRYLDGGTLGEILLKGSVSLSDTLDIVTQVCSALDYAHRKGIVHRDIKPDNIMVDSEGAAYLTDFGIAKALEAPGGLTKTGVAVGTPEYMAPEQALGLDIDGRTDIYALGVILYQLVVGRAPYQAKTPMAVALAHIHEPLPLPHEVNPNVPEDIETVILTALAKDPNERYQTAPEFAQALQSAVRTAETLETILPDQNELSNLIGQIQSARTHIPTLELSPDTFSWHTAEMAAPTVESPKRKLPLPPAVFAGLGALLVIGLVWLGVSVLGNDTPGGQGSGQPVGQASNRTIYDGPPNFPPAPGIYAYDDFDDKTFDGSTNQDLWYFAADAQSDCQITQQNGQLQLSNQASGESICDLTLTLPPGIMGQHLDSFEFDMQLLDDHNGQPIATMIQVETPLGGDDIWGAACGIYADPEPVLLFEVYDMAHFGEAVTTIAEQPIDYNTWHTIGFYVDHFSFEISCLLDGEEVGAYAPDNPTSFSSLRFNRSITGWWSEDATGTTLVDNFLMIVIIP